MSDMKITYHVPDNPDDLPLTVNEVEVGQGHVHIYYDTLSPTVRDRHIEDTTQHLLLCAEALYNTVKAAHNTSLPFDYTMLALNIQAYEAAKDARDEALRWVS